MIRHAGLVARRFGGSWRGALIEGPSGSGKSDLALRAIGHGFRLAADDRTLVFASRGRLFGRAPGILSGLIEVRGLGVLREPAVAFAEIVLVVRCAPDPQAVSRLPDPAGEVILGVWIPLAELWPFEPSAPMKLSRAVEYLGAHSQQGYQARFARPALK
jgi:serine kinase of HPr protein (carbohydrate metabolism regulator)